MKPEGLPIIIHKEQVERIAFDATTPDNEAKKLQSSLIEERDSLKKNPATFLLDIEGRIWILQRTD